MRFRVNVYAKEPQITERSYELDEMSLSVEREAYLLEFFAYASTGSSLVDPRVLRADFS